MNDMNTEEVEHGVRLAPAVEKYVVANGPMTIEMRSVPSGLTALAAGIVRFDEGGSTDPWSLPYEEVFHVSSGELRIHIGDDMVAAGPGEVLTIPRGTTVVYEGTSGTEAFYALTPADWYRTHPNGL